MMIKDINYKSIYYILTFTISSCFDLFLQKKDKRIESG